MPKMIVLIRIVIVVLVIRWILLLLFLEEAIECEAFIVHSRRIGGFELTEIVHLANNLYGEPIHRKVHYLDSVRTCEQNGSLSLVSQPGRILKLFWTTWKAVVLVANFAITSCRVNNFVRAVSKTNLINVFVESGQLSDLGSINRQSRVNFVCRE